MRPGITKSVNVTDTYSHVAALYTGVDSDRIIKEGDANASGILLSFTTYAVQLAFAETKPQEGTKGHPLAAGDSFNGVNNGEWLRKAWVKNDAASSTAVAIITPLFAE